MRHCFHDQIKEDEMDGMCSRHREYRNAHRNFNLKTWMGDL